MAASLQKGEAMVGFLRGDEMSSLFEAREARRRKRLARIARFTRPKLQSEIAVEALKAKLEDASRKVESAEKQRNQLILQLEKQKFQALLPDKRRLMPLFTETHINEVQAMAQWLNLNLDRAKRLEYTTRATTRLPQVLTLYSTKEDTPAQVAATEERLSAWVRALTPKPTPLIPDTPLQVKLMRPALKRPTKPIDKKQRPKPKRKHLVSQTLPDLRHASTADVLRAELAKSSVRLARNAELVRQNMSGNILKSTNQDEHRRLTITDDDSAALVVEDESHLCFYTSKKDIQDGGRRIHQITARLEARILKIFFLRYAHNIQFQINMQDVVRWVRFAAARRLARSIVTFRFHESLRSTLYIWHDCTLQMRFIEQTNASIRIQARGRGTLFRLHLRHESYHCIRIQAWLRAQRVRIRRHHDTHRLKLSTNLSSRAITAALVRHRAALKINTLVRATFAKTMYKRQYEALLLLQAAARSSFTRSLYQKQRQAIQKLQALARGRRDRTQVKKAHGAAVLLQRNIRGTLQRGRYVRTSKEPENTARPQPALPSSSIDNKASLISLHKVIQSHHTTLDKDSHANLPADTSNQASSVSIDEGHRTEDKEADTCFPPANESNQASSTSIDKVHPTLDEASASTDERNDSSLNPHQKEKSPMTLDDHCQASLPSLDKDGQPSLPSWNRDSSQTITSPDSDTQPLVVSLKIQSQKLVPLVDDDTKESIRSLSRNHQASTQPSLSSTSRQSHPNPSAQEEESQANLSARKNDSPSNISLLGNISPTANSFSNKDCQALALKKGVLLERPTSSIHNKVMNPLPVTQHQAQVQSPESSASTEYYVPSRNSMQKSGKVCQDKEVLDKGLAAVLPQATLPSNVQQDSLLKEDIDKKEETLSRRVIQITALARGHLARRRLLDLKNSHAASTRLTALARGHAVRLRVRHLISQQQAAILIAALVRGFSSRRHIRKRHSAATKIAARCRGQAARLGMIENLRQQKAATIIAANFRGRAARRKVQLRRIQLEQDIERSRAATRIAAHSRGRAARKRTMPRRKKKVLASHVKEEQEVLSVGAHIPLRKGESYFDARASYLEWQEVHYGSKVRLLQRFIRKQLREQRRSKAANLIEAAWRRSLARREALRIQAAVQLQLSVRLRQARDQINERRRQREVSKRRKLAASILQAHIRGALVRVRAARTYHEEVARRSRTGKKWHEKAAKSIQCCVRKCLARRVYTLKKYELEQRRIKSIHELELEASLDAMVREQEYELMAMRIQSCVRVWIACRKTKTRIIDLAEEQTRKVQQRAFDAAAKIQARTRGLCSRFWFETNKARLEESALLRSGLQRLMRKAKEDAEKVQARIRHLEKFGPSDFLWQGISPTAPLDESKHEEDILAVEDAWIQQYDPSAQATYWYNTVSGEASWTAPAQHDESINTSLYYQSDGYYDNQQYADYYYYGSNGEYYGEVSQEQEHFDYYQNGEYEVADSTQDAYPLAPTQSEKAEEEEEDIVYQEDDTAALNEIETMTSKTVVTVENAVAEGSSAYTPTTVY